MIAHCELMGDRVAILDPPPGLNAQQIKEWRVEKAGYDSKYATLYWPWVKVFDPATRQERVRAAERPHGRHLGPQRRHARRAQGARQRGRPRRHRPRDQHHEGGAGPAQPGGHQLHPLVPGPRHPRLGRPHALERSRRGATSTSAGCSTTSRSRSSRAPSGSSSSRTTSISGSGSSARSTRSCSVSGATARCSGRRRSRRSTSSATRRPTRPTSSTRAGHLRDRHRAGQAGGVRHLPYRPVLGRRGRRE